MRRFLLKLANLFHPQAEREMTREIESHLALLQEDFERSGMSPKDAKLAARRAYGNVEGSKELHREARTFLWLEQFVKDIRYGVRNLKRSPGMAATAIAAIALGIGGTTAIFSVVNTVLLKPLPIPESDRLVVLAATGEEEGGFNPAASPAMFAQWRAQPSGLETIAATTEDSVMNYTGGEVLEQWTSTEVSADYFRCVGVRLLKGRSFTAEEDLPNGPLVAVISRDLWERRFASDPAILGRKVSLNDRPYTIVGVLDHDPFALEFGGADVFTPFQLDPNSTDHGQYFLVIARLAPGISLEQAKERLQALATEFRAKFPKIAGPNFGFGLLTAREMLIGDVSLLLTVLLAAVGLVLLIACANVANLLLARATGRRREIGIRAAMGATKGRIIRQLLTESVLLALAGGALGLWLGHNGIRALLAVNTFELERVGEGGASVLLDGRVALFALLTSLATGVIFGLLPALHGSRVDLNSALKDSGGRTGTGLRQNKARAVLVICEVGLAVILLVGSALLIRSFSALYGVDRGFETKNVVTMRVLLSGEKYDRSEGVANTVETALTSIRALPGVEAASAGCCIPLQDQNTLTFTIPGRPPLADMTSQIAGYAPVFPDYFEVFSIAVKRGRTFDQRDRTNGPPVAIINEAMAKRYWEKGDPLTDRLVIGKGIMKEFDEEPVRQIIGIVADMRDTGLRNAPRPMMYIPQAQLPDAFTANYFRDSTMNWMVRTRVDPHQLAPAIQERLRQATGLPVSNLKMMDEVVSLSTARDRFGVLLMSAFGAVALLLAGIGIYGLMAYTVEQRKQEIGIRLALGAEASELRNMVIRQGMLLAVSGIGVGLAASWALAQTLESFLFGVEARDPWVFAAVPVALGLVALLAVWVPARRTLKVDPAEALRCE